MQGPSEKVTLATDVCVVGAGLAGLSAAERLTNAGQRCVILEARDRVGGRLLNHDLGDGQVVEVGGQWIGPTQDHAIALASRLGLERFPTHETGDYLMELHNRTLRYTGTQPKFGPLESLDLLQLELRIKRLVASVRPHAPWETPRAARLDRETLASWAARTTATRTSRDLISLVSEGVFATQPEDLSLLHFLFYVRAAGALETLEATTGGAQQDRIVGGSQLLALRLAERLDAQLELEQPVRSIARDADGVTVVADGMTVRARHAIVAIPPVLAGRIAWTPAMPPQRDGLTQRMPMGAVIKCMAVYDEPFWRADGLTGQTASTTGPVSITYDNSPPSGRPGVLLAFLEGRAARQLGGASPADRRAAVLACLVRLFGPRAARPDAWIEHDWQREPWTLGCYGGYLQPGGWTAYGPALRAPVDNIHFAGAETAERWCGYMDGAISSGLRAADEVLGAPAEGLASPALGNAR